ncbi:methyltransferase-like protein 24 isoform X2 [Cynoglossus semilaevis]|nr:methyltransferase-like protein 24 isoform X2 [Cynoglossus semilaevis]
MRSWRSSRQLSLRSGALLLLLLLGPPLLVALQLIVIGPRLPRTAALGTGEREGAVAFSVISIEPERSSQRWGPASVGPRLQEEEEMEKGGGRREQIGAYEDEKEIHQVGSRDLEVQPWATGRPSFTAELGRLIAYITTPQLKCSRVIRPAESQASAPPAASAQWLLCAEDWLLPAADGPCVAYSFSMDGRDADFLKTVSMLGCEVHRFDPSNPNASAGHLGNSLDGNHGDRGVVNQHKMWLEWRAPRKHKARGNLGSVSQTLSDIMAALGHPTVNFVYADLLSVEWRVFQNWIESGTLQSVHHLVATVHLQWAGFEVGGTNEEVLRYWFSVLQGLQDSGLKLVHSSAGFGSSVLKQAVNNAHSSYTLSWVNTRH